MQALWLKTHKKVMEEKEEENKLLAEIEPLKKEKRELVETIKQLRKEVSVHGEYYRKITDERIEEVNKLDEKFISLKELNEQLEEKNKIQSVQNNNLQQANKKLEEKILEGEEREKLLNLELETLKALSQTIRLSKEDYEDEKRIELRKILIELNEAREELRTIKKDAKQEMDRVVEENRLLGVRRNDLEIYESRMRKKYPNEKFILT
jgi:hypothetical protein